MSSQRRLYSPARAALLLLALGLTLSVAGAPSTARAAPEQDAADGPTALGDDALLDRARALAARLGAAEAKMLDDAVSITAARDLGRERLAQAARFEAGGAPQPPTSTARPPSSRPLEDEAKAQPGSSAESLRARLEETRAGERVAGARERARLLEGATSAFEDASRRLESLRLAAQDAATSLGELESAADEVARRVVRGEISKAAAPEPLPQTRNAEIRGRIATARALHESVRAEVEDGLRRLPAEVLRSRAWVVDAESALAVATRRARDAARRDVIAKEIAAKDPGTLASLLAASSVERERRRAVRDEARAAAAAAVTAAAEAEALLLALPGPDPAALVLTPAPPRVLEAERALRLSTATAEYHAARAGLLASLSAAIGRAAERLEAEARAGASLADELIREEVARELASPASRTPTAGPVEAASGLLAQEVAEAAQAAQEASLAASSRAAKVAKRIEEERALEAAERARRAGLEAALTAAREDARFTKEVETLPVAQVLASFEQAVEQLSRAEISITGVRERLALVDDEVAALEDRFRKLEDPLVRRARAEIPDARDDLRDALYRAIGREPPPSAPSAPAARPRALEPANGAASPPAPDALRATEEMHTVIAARLRIFDEQLAEAATIPDILERRRALVETLIAAETAALDRARRALGAALELTTRVGLGEIKAEALPRGVAEVLRRDRIASLESDLETRRADLAAVERRAALLERRISEVREKRALAARSTGIAARKLDALRERAQVEARFERGKGPLTETEQRRLDQELVHRLEAATTTVELVLGLFQSARAEELFELLKAYTGDLIELERQVDNLDMRAAITRRLLALSDEERAVITDSLPVARAEVLRARAALVERRMAVGLTPRTDRAALALLGEASREPPAPAPVSASAIPAEADALQDRAARVRGMELWLQEIERRLSRAGIDADVGAAQDELGAIEARKAGLRLQVERLVGRPRDAVAALPVPARPRTPAEEAKLLKGEIGAARAERLDVLIRAAAIAALSLVIVPVLAFQIVRGGRRLGAHIVRRIRDDGDPEEALEREQRAQTLVNVVQASWSAVIWIGAAIYMLKQLRFDVTPIIASAGVVGLAIAFGAQQLIRDFLAGFFMLLEGQFKIGDVIRIGDVAGTVEMITLRLTVLRDVDGTVHFIPNGTVQRVSNMTKDWSRAVIEVGVAYKEDVDRVTAVLRIMCDEMKSDRGLRPKLVGAPEVQGVERLGDSSVVVRLLLKTRPGEQWTIAREARRRIKKALEAAGIEIPFPQQVVHYVGRAPAEVEKDAAPPKA